MQLLCFILMIFNFLEMISCLRAISILGKRGQKGTGVWILMILLVANIFYMMQSI